MTAVGAEDEGACKRSAMELGRGDVRAMLAHGGDEGARRTDDGGWEVSCWRWRDADSGVRGSIQLCQRGVAVKVEVKMRKTIQSHRLMPCGVPIVAHEGKRSVFLRHQRKSRERGVAWRAALSTEIVRQVKSSLLFAKREKESNDIRRKGRGQS